MPMLTLKGLRFHVQRAGSGPDVVLIHGLTGDLSIWMLCKAMSALADRFRLTAYDLRGHGYSDAPAANYTSNDHAHDLIALLDDLEIESAHLVGHSFGAVIALHAAVIAPGRIASLVLSDPYFPALRYLEDVSKWDHWRSFHQEAENAGVLLSDEHWYDLGKFFDQVVHLEPDRMLKLRQAVGLPGLNRLLRLGATTCGSDSKLAAGLTSEAIAAVSQPVLALYGEGSPFLATADYLTKNLKNCHAAYIPGAKHRAPEENPRAFVEQLREFLNRVATPALVEELA